MRALLRKIPGLPVLHAVLKQGSAYRTFKKQFQVFEALSRRQTRGFALRWKDRYPCLNDQTENTHFDRHYVFHLAWAARVLAELKPASHVDIGSSLHFCTMLSAFIPTKFYDVRPADLQLKGMTSEAANLLALPHSNNSLSSLSCMHVLEHVGLGRYGDPLDPEGDLKAFSELQRVLVPGGSLLIVVPVGQPRVLFNAHRIYAYEQIVEAFKGLTLKEFALIPDDPQEGGLVRDASPDRVKAQTYACGCFWFQKK